MSVDLEYAMIIEPAEDEHGTYYCAYFPDLPGCATMGASLEELRVNAIEAVSGHIESLKNLGKPVPKPRSRTETIVVKAS
jgi:predicted RNase H-like HicB family nuclease